uniref:BTB domain-containing protein n=1 Tax=Caenorhabditis tropicalis TaxID=1561998 RepID=A0A1I7UKU0_9PELO
MSVRHKYAFNGVCSFDNAPYRMYWNLCFGQIPIGKTGGIDDWRIGLRFGIENNRVFYEPHIICRSRNRPTLRCRYYLSFLKNNGESAYAERRTMDLKLFHPLPGRKVWVEELFDGYLTDGAIRIEYGLQIDWFLFPDNIWTFNFHHLLSGSGQLNYDSFLPVLAHARKKSLVNVIKLIDQILKMDTSDHSFSEINGLSHCLTDLLRKQESLGGLAEELKKVDVEAMSGEAMKKFVRFFFNH